MSSLRAWLFRKSPQPPPYVIENTAQPPPRLLATVFGIERMATSVAWIAPIWMAIAGVVAAFLIETDAEACLSLATLTCVSGGECADPLSV
jgi:hypothetical protein